MTVRSAPWSEAVSLHAERGGEDLQRHAQAADRRLHALSTRRLTAKLGVSHMMVARSWSKHRLQPHRLKRYMSSNNLDFEQKAADTIGLYLNPSARGGVLRGREDGDSGPAAA